MISGTGGSFGFVYDTNLWKIQEFETMENAYALCEFIGNSSFIFVIFSYHYRPFFIQIEIYNVISTINFGKLLIVIGKEMMYKWKILVQEIISTNSTEFWLRMNMKWEIIGREKPHIQVPNKTLSSSHLDQKQGHQRRRSWVGRD